MPHPESLILEGHLVRFVDGVCLGLDGSEGSTFCSLPSAAAAWIAQLGQPPNCAETEQGPRVRLTLEVVT